MDQPTFNKIVSLLLPHMGDPDERRALLESALFGSPLLAQIDWTGAARTFTTRLVRKLHDFGETAPGTPALVALLDTLKSEVGTDKQTEIDTTIKQLTAHTTPAAPIDPPEPAEKTTSDERIFISYQRNSETDARQINTHLTNAGFTVWQDIHNIRHTDRWSASIHEALTTCDRIVLLITEASMQSREVFNEWFYFYSKRKPIHCLLLEDCDIHYQLLPYQYLDWRTSDARDWPRLVRELSSGQPDATATARGETIVDTPHAPDRTRDEAQEALLDVIRSGESIALSEAQITALKDHKPADITAYRVGRIAEWSLPRYQLDNRFVNLTLLLDKGENDPQRWQPAENRRYNDLRDVLRDHTDYPALVLLGAPGSGKSTLLRRLQLDHSIDRLREDDGQITFFIQLNGYRTRPDGTLPEPRAWLAERWHDRYPDLPPLDEVLRAGKVLLLLDALNEMPHKDTDEYHERVGFWRGFAQDAARMGNRLLFSCRTLDYSALLSSSDLRVPQVEVQPMSEEQVRGFLTAYVPAHEQRVWDELDGSPQFDLFRTPYFLKLLCEQVDATGDVPRGRAGLFTGFVRSVIRRELEKGNPLLRADTLLNEQDHRKMNLGRWRNTFDLPERGVLIPRLSHLAYTMQASGLSTESKQVRIDYDDACDLIEHERDADILKAGVALSVLDEDITQYEIAFFHQLLQEFFAARKLAQNPDPALVQVAWHVDAVSPTLDETLAELASGDPLPPLPQTGWEETTLTAAPMARDPDAFIRALLPHNLPLAARCAASPEVSVDPGLKREIQDALIARTQDSANADLRARIAAGLALGDLGDPRFECHTGPHGDYLLPPMVTIPAGTYPIGDDDSQYDDEKPAHTVELDAFEIGAFPVTNAEYALFIEAGGYEDEQWWDTDEALAWLRGEGSTDGQKASWRDTRKQLLQMSEDQLRGMTNLTSEQKDGLITIRVWTDEHFENWLDETFPSGQTYRQPGFWDDARFNSPTQPVVGVTWFEARAYCNWLSANALTPGPSPERRGEQIYTLPTEVQFEAAARGTAGREYPYDSPFDSTRSNTFESHIRRTTPVGIFDNATPEGAFDLTGNAYTWTTTIYDQEQFRYPYQPDDGRENESSINTRRVLRGGSWSFDVFFARAASRDFVHPTYRNLNCGFRLCRAPSRKY